MLRLDFINVGDGDAILIREYSGKKSVFTMLVDCGLEDIPPQAGSVRQTAAAYLYSQGIAQIDLLVITHLHLDHFGGLALLHGIRIQRMLCGYLPDGDLSSVNGQAAAGSSASVQGLYRSLETFVKEVDHFKKQGCLCLPAAAGEHVLTAKLQMNITLADADLMARQRTVLTAMQMGENLPEALLYRVSKERNNASLRLSPDYAGRRILLPGDAYNAYWENEPDALPCDIFKLPHHGDEKSLTLSLMHKLRPAYAVVSGLMGDEAKRRPAAETINLLKQGAGQFILLENDEVGSLEAASIKAAVFCIDDQGNILFETVP